MLSFYQGHKVLFHAISLFSPRVPEITNQISQSIIPLNSKAFGWSHITSRVVFTVNRSHHPVKEERNQLLGVSMNPIRFDKGWGEVLIRSGHLHPLTIRSMAGSTMLKIKLFASLDHLAV
jgi:hypothetical protein